MASARRGQPVRGTPRCARAALTLGLVERLLARLVQAARVLGVLAERTQHKLRVDLVVLLVGLRRLDGNLAVLERAHVLELRRNVRAVRGRRLDERGDALCVEGADRSSL
jgi:hypothetical protein